MARRLQLHAEFCRILGTENVYFQPPASVKLKYPCIIYKIQDRNDLRADDDYYRGLVRYEVTVIYRDPDSTLPEDVMHLTPRARSDRHFTIDDLHHDIFTLYY